MLVNNDTHQGETLSERPIRLPLTGVKTTYCVTHLYANEICARDERHAIIFVSRIETFIFLRGIFIQKKPMKWCNDKINPADEMQK